MARHTVHWSRCFGYFTLFAGLLAGCADEPARPAFNAKKCANAAISAYDTDGDQVLSEAEYSKSPGLLNAAKRIDTNQDLTISKDEIAARIDYYRNATTAVVSGRVRILKKGRPLENASVTFVPETFLGDEFQPCSGMTDERGETFVSRQNAEFPGIYLGMYRVEVTQDKDGQEMLPAKYNSETELGFEAANDLPGVSDYLQFDL